MYYPFVRKALFQLDPERAHELTFQQLRRVTGTPLEALIRQKVPAKPVTCMGLTFKIRSVWPPVWIRTGSVLMPWARWDLARSRSAP